MFCIAPGGIGGHVLVCIFENTVEQQPIKSGTIRQEHHSPSVLDTQCLGLRLQLISHARHLILQFSLEQVLEPRQGHCLKWKTQNPGQFQPNLLASSFQLRHRRLLGLDVIEQTLQGRFIALHYPLSQLRQPRLSQSYAL